MSETARARVEAALAAMTPGPWTERNTALASVVVAAGVPLFGMENGLPTTEAEANTSGIATLRNDTAAALAEAEAAGRAGAMQTVAVFEDVLRRLMEEIDDRERWTGTNNRAIYLSYDSVMAAKSLLAGSEAVRE